MTVQRILFVELLGGIGDLIFILPALDALHTTYPTASLDVFTFAPGGELLVGDPRVHEVLFARRGTGLEVEAPYLADLRAILATVAYDLVISDTRHSQIHELIDVSISSRTVTQLWSGASPDEPISRLFVRRLQEEGVVDWQWPFRSPKLMSTIAERIAALQAWSSIELTPERTVGFNPHSGVAVKRWPTDHFVDVGRALVCDGWRIAVLAGDDPELAESLVGQIPEARVVPKMSLRSTAAFLERIGLLISGDSGIAHLAGAVGAPTIAIYGPTWAGRYGVAGPAANLQSPFDCPELSPMNFTTQRCWYSGWCIFTGKLTCCADVDPGQIVRAAHRLLPQPGGRSARAG